MKQLAMVRWLNTAQVVKPKKNLGQKQVVKVNVEKIANDVVLVAISML